MKLFKYTEDQLREAVAHSSSFRQVLLALEVAPYGGNYDVLQKAIKHFSLNTSHFTGQAWNKGKTLKPKQPIEKYLNNDAPIQSYKLELRCSHCRSTVWLGQPIPLELDHINGDKKDNRLKNIRLLCPNCHAFTPTYRSKNRSKA